MNLFDGYEMWRGLVPGRTNDMRQTLLPPFNNIPLDVSEELAPKLPNRIRRPGLALPTVGSKRLMGPIEGNPLHRVSRAAARVVGDDVRAASRVGRLGRLRRALVGGDPMVPETRARRKGQSGVAHAVLAVVGDGRGAASATGQQGAGEDGDGADFGAEGAGYGV
jgi:hypothetical protein